MASKTLPWRGPLFLLSKRKWVITSWVCFLRSKQQQSLSLSLHLQRWKEQTLTCEFERLPLLVRSGFRADRSNLAWETSQLFIEIPPPPSSSWVFSSTCPFYMKRVLSVGQCIFRAQLPLKVDESPMNGNHEEVNVEVFFFSLASQYNFALSVARLLRGPKVKRVS